MEAWREDDATWEQQHKSPLADVARCPLILRHTHLLQLCLAPPHPRTLQWQHTQPTPCSGSTPDPHRVVAAHPTHTVQWQHTRPTHRAVAAHPTHTPCNGGRIPHPTHLAVAAAHPRLRLVVGLLAQAVQAGVLLRYRCGRSSTGSEGFTHDNLLHMSPLYMAHPAHTALQPRCWQHTHTEAAAPACSPQLLATAPPPHLQLFKQHVHAHRQALALCGQLARRRRRRLELLFILPAGPQLGEGILKGARRRGGGGLRVQRE